MDEIRAFRNLNISVFLHFLGRQAYSIFVPVILLKNGYSLALVIAFLVLSSGVTIISSYLGQKIMSGKNVIFFNLLAVGAEISLLLLLLKSGSSLKVFIPMLIFEGLYYAFYYLSYFALTTHYTSRQETGNNLGNLTISVALASIVGPLIGSYVLSDSKIYLIATAISALILSLLPILRISKPDVEDLKSGKPQIGSIKIEIFNYGILACFEVVIFVLWGVYAYISEFTLLNIGLIAVATSLARIVVSSSIKSKLKNKSFRRKVMTLSVLGLAATSIYRFHNPSHIVLTNFMMSFFYVGYQLGTQTAIITQLKGNRTYYSSMLLQVITFSMRIPIYLLVFLVGLKSIILLPVLAAALFITFNFSTTNFGI